MPNRLRILLPLLAPSIAIVAPTSWAESTARLEAEAAPARASVRPQPANRKFLNLPSLEYEIAITARCAADFVVESVSVSVADTRKTLRGEELGDAPEIVTSILIPAQQVAPVAAGGFCLAGRPSARELLVRDAFTAHVSLRCASDNGSSIVYATRPLAVAINCESGDQGESAPPILR